MLRCLQLAESGLGIVAPNPMVGCVIVRNGQVIGEGYHHAYGGPHAEVNAIHAVSDGTLLGDAELYVNLEPCSHHGKTPPCADLIINMGIPRVFVGCMDPNPLVSGKGVAKLRSAGIEVVTDVLHDDCTFLNKRFMVFQIRRRPYIILKWAQTEDGFIDGLRKPMETGIRWITSEASRRMVHLWRSQEAGILVGRGTVINDDPELTVREVKGKNPVRIVIDPALESWPTHRVFNQASQTLAFNRLRSGSEGNIDFVRTDFGAGFMDNMMRYLYERQIQSVIVEGGAITLSAFLEAGLWDEARVFTGAIKLMHGLKAPALPHRPDVELSSGTDRLRIYYNKLLPTV
jgi:diaminohydroxyphosphoribosylaminopyrimidine deaminase / 5-amino-6-(5-phosphoribosylamino)uracil reductase